MDILLEGMDRIRKIELYLSLAIAFAFICYLVALPFIGYETEVMRDRFWKDVEPLFNGHIPIMEYPPFSLFFMAIPRIFASTPYSYNVAYVIEVYIFVIIGMEITRRLAEHYGADQIKAIVIYSVFLVLLLPFVTDRYDIFPAVMCLGAFYLFLKNHTNWAFVILALGALTKVYPAFLILVFMMAMLVRRDWKGIGMGMLVSIVTALAVVAPFYILEPESVIHFITYNSDRPLEIGSMPATLIYPFSMIGLTDVWILAWDQPGSYGSDDLMGPLPEAVAGIMTPLMVLATLATVFYYGHITNRKERSDERIFLAAAGCLIAILALILFGKVFSSQYLIWAIPFYVLVLVMSPNEKFFKKLLTLILVMFIFTETNCGYIYGYLNGGTNIDDLSMILMLLRNLMVVYSMWIVGKEMWTVHKEGFTGEERGTYFENNY